MGDSLVAQFDMHRAFVPGNLRSGLSTILAKDNVDSNANSSTVTRHYHGTSMTIMQFPTVENLGVEVHRPVPDDTARATSKRVKPIPDDYANPPYVYFPKLSELYTTPLKSKMICTVTTQYILRVCQTKLNGWSPFHPR